MHTFSNDFIIVISKFLCILYEKLQLAINNCRKQCKYWQVQKITTLIQLNLKK